MSVWVYLLLCALGTTPVTSKTEWLHVPQSKAVLIGQDVLLNCAAYSDDETAVVYSWYQGNQSIPGHFSLYANHSLLIPRISHSELGIYYCAVDSNGTRIISPEAMVIAAYLSDFVVHPQSVRTAENEVVTFECVSGKSAPYPDVFWELNGVRLRRGNQSRTTYGDYDETGLRIQYSLKLVLVLTAEYVGVVRCAAENSVLGSTVYSQSANITIAVTPGPPVIERPPPSQVLVFRGQHMVLPCSVTGYPWPRTVWFKDGLFIDGSANSYIAVNGSFVFVSVSAADSGVYVCKGINSVGETESPTCNVTVAYLDLVFSVEPDGLTVFAGQSATLLCTPPESYPAATVTWYKDYQPITPVPQSIADTVITSGSAMTVIKTESGGWDLFFPSVQKSDAGWYFCVATNSVSKPNSRTSRLAHLQVVGAPTITEPPVDTRIVKGRLLHLICHVEANPTPTIDWTFLGQNLESSSHVSFRDRKQELFISNVNKAWDGVYTCLATNKYGSKTAEATVTVLVPPVTLNPIGQLLVKAGQQLLLPCDVYGIPTPTLTWFHNNQELQLRKGMVFLDRALFINSVVEEDKGTYYCSALNEAGTTEAHGNITVLLPPSIIQSPQSVLVLIGHPAVMSCSVHGFPKPTLDWLYNSSLVLPEGVTVESHDLSIQSVGWKHVGVYTCVANNSEGSAQKSAVLKITVPPYIVELQGSVAVDTGNTIKVTCVFGGVPRPSVKWKHQGRMVEASLDGRISFPSPDVLLVKFSSAADSGEYSCHIANSVGNAERKITVYVIEPPYPPVLTSAVAVSMFSVYLQWVPNTQEPMTNVTGYAVHMKKTIEEEFVTFPGRLPPDLNSYEVEGLKPGTEYVFTVSAENSAGLGKPSNVLSVRTFESGPSEPRFFEVKTKDSTSIGLFWEVPAVQNGEVSLYELQYWEKSSQHNVTSVEIVNPTVPSQEYVINDLHPHTVYMMRVRAANIERSSTLWGNFTQVIEAKTSVAAPTVAPTGLEVTSVDPYSVQMKWNPLTKHEENGPMIGYRVTYKQTDHVTAVEDMVYNTTTAFVSQLSPWTEYSFVVEAVNTAGHGPPTNAVIGRTLPTAPAAAPRNVQVMLTTDRAVAVTWQPPPKDKQNSELTGYLLQYRKTGDLKWKSVNFTQSSVRSYNISDLDYWTEYEIQVAAYTNQVSAGLGTFSPAIFIKTRQGVPGPVESVFHNASLSSIYLHWWPPHSTNGMLTYYHVVCYVTNTSSDTANMSVTSPELRSIANLSVKVPQVTLRDLEPDTTYLILVTTNTAAGEGTPVIVLQRTDQEKLPPSSTEHPTTEPPETSTEYLVGGMDDSTKQRLAVIVAGSLTGGIIVLFILALIIYRCLRKRRDEIRKYMTSGVSGIKIIKRSSMYDRHFDDPAEEYACDSSTNSMPSHNAADSTPDYGSCSAQIEAVVTPEQTTTPVTLSSAGASHAQTEVLDVSALDHPGIRKKSNSFREDLLRKKPDPALSTSELDSPGYYDNMSAATLPRPRTTKHMSADEFYSQMLTMPRKNRMRSESAAAIAILRNSNMEITTSDTESLVANEAIVVFKERTVL